MNNTFISLLIAHLAADYYLQTDKLCREKAKKVFTSAALYLHVCIVSVTALAALLLCKHSATDVLQILVIVTLSHGVIDGAKLYLNKIYPDKESFLFFTDQLIHIVIIAYLTWNFTDPVNHSVLYLLGYLVCFKPANIVIKNIIRNYINLEGNNKEDLPNAGKLIGLAERTITLTLVLLGQFEAIGFLIAAKSILRYGEKTQQTEYVLIGTLLSFGIAILVGCIVQQF